MDEDGWSCAAYAATNPCHETAAAAMRLLAAHNANFNVPAKDGRQPLALAACQEWRNVPALLACGAGACKWASWGTDVGVVFHPPFGFWCLTVLLSLHFAEPNAVDHCWGMNALHYTCSRALTADDAIVAIRALLAAGAGKHVGPQFLACLLSACQHQPLA